MKENSPTNWIIIIGYGICILFVMIVILYHIYNYINKPKVLIGLITIGRSVIVDNKYYDYVRKDNAEDILEIDDSVEGYLKNCYDYINEIYYDIFVITKKIKEPCTVD